MPKKIILDIREDHEYKKGHVNNAHCLHLSLISLSYKQVLKDYKDGD
jgi:rhodanese-related sulfurtransferase